MKKIKLEKIKNLEQLTKHRVAAEEKKKALIAELAELKASASEAAALGEDVGKILDRRSKVEMEIETMTAALEDLNAKHLELSRLSRLTAAEKYAADSMKIFDETVIPGLRSIVEALALEDQARRIHHVNGTYLPVQPKPRDKAGREALADELYRMVTRAAKPAAKPAKPLGDMSVPTPKSGPNLDVKRPFNAEEQEKKDPRFSDDPNPNPYV